MPLHIQALRRAGRRFLHPHRQAWVAGQLRPDYKVVGFRAGGTMILTALGALVGLSLVVNVAVDRAMPDTVVLAPGLGMSAQEQRATMLPLIRSANECIARFVSANPRFEEQAKRGEVNDLIVESIPSCLDAVRALIDGHDRIYGQGSGESFFMGPYLDALPTVVNKLVRSPGR